MTTSPITITAELLDDLQRKAKAATPGPWAVNPLDIEYEDNSIYASTLSNGTRRLICTVSTGSSAPGNRAHIAAASPAVVDALVEHIRSLTERLAYIERNYVGSCFNWDDNGMCVLAIKIGDSVPVTRNFTAVISAAIAQEGADHE